MSNEMTNAMLRKHARHVYWQNRGQLWILFLLVTVLNMGWTTVSKYLLPNNSLAYIISVIYSLAIMPVTAFGLYHVLLRLIRGKKVKVFMAFDLFKAPFHPLKVYAAAVIMLFPSLLLTTVSFISFPTISSAGGIYLLFIFILGILYLLMWLFLRLFLFPYLVVTQPDERLFKQVKASFQQMKGQVGNLLWFMITVMFPIILLSIVLIYLYILYITNIQQPNISQTVSTVFMIFQPLISLFFFPYVYLAYAAFVNQMLKAQSSLTND